MRAISLWQPWASAIALGAKTIETRHWNTNYRGPLAIHAAKRCNKEEMRDFAADTRWQGALRMHSSGLSLKGLDTGLPFGAIVALCDLTNCKPTQQYEPAFLQAKKWNVSEGESHAWCEDDMGDFHPGRYGWELNNVIALPEPIQFKGAQGFFHIPDELLQDIRPWLI